MTLAMEITKPASVACVSVSTWKTGKVRPILATPAGTPSKMQAKQFAKAAVGRLHSACCQVSLATWVHRQNGSCGCEAGHTCIPTIASAVLRLVAPGAAGREKIFWDSSALIADTLARGTREKAGTPLVWLRRKALRPSCQRLGPMLLRLLLLALSLLCEASMESRVEVPGFSMPCQDIEKVWFVVSVQPQS